MKEYYLIKYNIKTGKWESETPNPVTFEEAKKLYVEKHNERGLYSIVSPEHFDIFCGN